MFGMLVVLFCAVLGNQPKEVEKEKSIKQEKKEEELVAVLKEVHTETGLLVVWDIDSQEEKILVYSGGTRIKDVYGKEIAMAQLSIGEIIDITYSEEKNKIKQIVISKKAWEYPKVENLVFDESKKRIQLGKENYHYTDDLVISSNGELIDRSRLNAKDELLVKGIGKTIYAIQVTKGHGYIKLKNNNDFIGGTIEIGYDIFLPIQENMLIVAREGSYKVILEKQGLRGSKRISVERDKELLLDMGRYQKEVVKKGSVDFLVQPAGAILTIDGKQKKYDEPIVLSYGRHQIIASATGYQTETKILEVKESGMVVEVNLEKEEGSTNKEDKQTTVQNDQPKIEQIDKEHKIQISQPEGAEVYWNQSYQGVVPCSFTKRIGTYTVSIRKEGYQTQSYTVEVVDDGKDATYQFPDLVKNKETKE